MIKNGFKVNISKLYMLLVLFVTMIILVSYYSYAMFTVSKVKNNAISIKTGNLLYQLTADNMENQQVTVGISQTERVLITVDSLNAIESKYQLYYEPNNNVIISYTNTYEKPTGQINANDTIMIEILIINISDTAQTVSFGIQGGLVNNEIILDEGNKAIENDQARSITQVLVANLLSDTTNQVNADDTEQIFITGENPDNYIWYSGKLWRAVSVDPTDNSIKLVTQWNIAGIGNSAASFEKSAMLQWLNDTSVDGFLGNLREPEKFIKTNSKWNATLTTVTTKPAKTTIITADVGLLNIYEYRMSYTNTTSNKGYLKNSLYWWTFSPADATHIHLIMPDGGIAGYIGYASTYGLRPAVNLVSMIRFAKGNESISNPYRLENDVDIPKNGTALATRYSGEYIRFGTGENNLYRIVSHEGGKTTKITSAIPLKDNNVYKQTSFGTTLSFSSSNTVGKFLNETYLTNYVDSKNLALIQDGTTWYLGPLASSSYWLTKYTDKTMTTTTSKITTAKVGLLRAGELLSGQTDIVTNNIGYWSLSPFNDGKNIRAIENYGFTNDVLPTTTTYGIRPALVLKPNTIILSGDGTKDNPFELGRIYTEYYVYMQDKGTLATVQDGVTAGLPDQNKRIEEFGFAVHYPSGFTGSVQYRAYVQNKGWLDYVNAGEYAGTKAQALRMEAFSIRLTGDLAEYFDIYYRAYVRGQGWQAFVKNNATAGTMGQALVIEAIQIKIEPK